MRIEHCAVYVSNLEGLREFYTRYFGASSGPRYRNAQTGFESYFLSFEGGTRLELMTCPNLAVSDRTTVPQVGYAHLAFSVGSRAEVDRRTKFLAEAGFTVVSGPRQTGDGYYESCILDPEGNRIEITE